MACTVNYAVRRAHRLDKLLDLCCIFFAGRTLDTSGHVMPGQQAEAAAAAAALLVPRLPT